MPPIKHLEFVINYLINKTENLHLGKMKNVCAHLDESLM